MYNLLLTKKIIISFTVFSMLLSGLCGLLYFWVTSSLVTLILASIYVSFEMLCSTAIVSVVVAIFPTSLRYDNHLNITVNYKIT